MSNNVFQRINKVREEINYIQKDKAVSTGAGSYKAVTHDAVTGMIRASLIKHGIVIVPNVVTCVFHPKEPDAKQRLYEATYQVDFINMDDPADRISMQASAHALDNGDKAPGKALSYATKYAILKVFNIETGEDEESRYQQTEFDVIPMLTAIEACETLDSLKTAYTNAYGAAKDAGDKEAMQAVIKVKDRIKKSIEEKLREEMAGQA